MNHRREAKSGRLFGISGNERADAEEEDDESHEVNDFVDAGVHDVVLRVMLVLVP